MTTYLLFAAFLFVLCVLAFASASNSSETPGITLEVVSEAAPVLEPARELTPEAPLSAPEPWAPVS